MPDTPTLARWFDEWLGAITRITPGTRATYQQQFRDHINSAFGAMPLGQITALDVGRWVNRRRAEGAKNTTITRDFSLLQQCLDAAIRARHIDRNPCKDTDFVRNQTADDDTGEDEVGAFAHDDFELLRERFDKKWHPLLNFLAYTGARWSEATAVATEHIVAPSADKPQPKVRIYRAWKRSGLGAERYLGTTKGRRRRELTVGMELFEELKPLLNGKKKGDLVFCGDEGQMIDYSNFYHRVWRPAMVEAQRCPSHPPGMRGERIPGLKGRCRDHGGTNDQGKPCGAWLSPGWNRCVNHIGPDPDAVSDCDCPEVLRLEVPDGGPHRLRHSCATWMFARGVPPLVVSRRLGHATLAITSEIYGHLMPDSDEEAAAALAGMRSKPATEEVADEDDIDQEENLGEDE
nr:site-specific integrase [Micromonospora jinlongensis]